MLAFLLESIDRDLKNIAILSILSFYLSLSLASFIFLLLQLRLCNYLYPSHDRKKPQWYLYIIAVKYISGNSVFTFKTRFYLSQFESNNSQSRQLPEMARNRQWSGRLAPTSWLTSWMIGQLFFFFDIKWQDIILHIPLKRR